MHRSPSAVTGYASGANSKVPGDNRQRMLSPSNSNKNSTSNTNIREPILSNGLGSAANADPSAMQEHFTTSAKKVKEKLMLDEMHELLEEPVEEQVRDLFLKFPKLMIMSNAVL